MAHSMQKEAEKYLKTNADTVTPYMTHTDAQSKARIVLDVAQLIILSEYARTQAERFQET